MLASFRVNHLLFDFTEGRVRAMEQVQVKSGVTGVQGGAPSVLGTDGKGVTLVDPTTIKVAGNDEVDPAIEAQAAKYADQLVNVDITAFKRREQSKAAVEDMGLELQRSAAHRSGMLEQPIKILSQKGADGGEVANALIALKLKVEELDPHKIDFEPGWVSRLAGRIPFVGHPLKKYFTQFESADTVIEAIVRSLKIGRDGLVRDNNTIIADQNDLREDIVKLQKMVQLATALDRQLESRLANYTSDDEHYKFIQDELLFPLRQRAIDIGQQLAVSQQGVLAMELVIRTNKELVRGVNRALNVTITALRTAVTVALAVAKQKIVLEKITALNTVTSDLIEKTAAQLRQQGAEIHKQSSTAMLNMQSLKNAFVDINAAFEDISTYRAKALEEMKGTIAELGDLNTQAKASIEKMDRGNSAAPALKIEVK